MKRDDWVKTPVGFGQFVAALKGVVMVRLAGRPFETAFLDGEIRPVTEEEQRKCDLVVSPQSLK